MLIFLFNKFNMKLNYKANYHIYEYNQNKILFAQTEKIYILICDDITIYYATRIATKITKIEIENIIVLFIIGKLFLCITYSLKSFIILNV